MTGVDRRQLPVRKVLHGPSEPDRIFYTGLWFKGHNNPRYAELLPRLRRLDRYLFVASDRRILRGIEYRAWAYTKPLHQRIVMRAAARRYRWYFTSHNEQIPHFAGPCVADVDDPRFTEREAELLSHPNLEAYVVTDERAARRFESMGVHKPWYVIPQGVSLSSLSKAEADEVRAAARRDGEIVIGWVAAWLLSADDRGGDNPLYNVDHLLDLWDDVHQRVPRGRLWLVGEASSRIRDRCTGRDDIVLFGRLERPTMLAHVANFDLALYPRTKDQGIQAAKVAEFMGLGVPTVSYDYEVTKVLADTGAGVLVPGPSEFVAAVERLAADDAERARIAAAARKAGRDLDWDALARRYEAEVLDLHLA